MTNIGPGTPAGNVLRSFWQPVALAEELNNDRPVVAVQVFGESLVLFRDQDGNLGLLERNCAHRGADLCYGRLEDNGIRCPFHGWLFSANGDCMEQPAEPEDSLAEGSVLVNRRELRLGSIESEQVCLDALWRLLGDFQRSLQK